jgi:hypothetical protein
MMGKKKQVKIYQKKIDGTTFWTATKVGFKGEKLLKTRMMNLPVSSGFYQEGREHNYISPTDAEFIRKEIQERKRRVK